MRRVWGASLGLGVGLVATASAQSPASRFGVVQALSTEEVRSGMVARGQSPAQPMPPTNPMGSVPLGPPKLFGAGPGVQEQRTSPGAMPTPPPTYYPTSNMPTAPYAVSGPQYAPPVGYPVPGAGADGGIFPAPELDAPLYGGSLPATGATSAMNKWYATGEYLVWWTRSASLPALITTSSPEAEGVIGQGNTRVLFGNGTFGNTMHTGGRFTLGYWLGCEQRWGVEGSGFFLGRNGQEFRADTGTFPVLARPFFNVNAGVPSSETVASPLRGATGGAAVRFENNLWGADVTLRRYLAKTNCARLDLVGGFKYISLDEELAINENYARAPDASTMFPLSGTVNDTFRTTNRFYGGHVGLTGEVRRGRFFANATGKVGFGTVFQTATISGSQNATLADGTTAAVPGGLYALPGANIGSFTRNKFAVAPEIGLNVGYHLTPHLRIFVGYNFLYLSNVLRPGDQIDQGLDVTRVPFFNVPGGSRLPSITDAARLSQTRPAPTLKDSDFFAQGVNFGLQFTW